MTRRGFLDRLAVGAMAAGAAEGAFAEALQDLRSPGRRTDDGYWAKVRSKFMIEEGFAYLNTGTVGPTPRPVFEAMTENWRLMAVNPNENSDVIHDRIETVRAKAAAFIGAHPDEVAITRNTTEGNTILARGLDLKAGDEILITAFEHDSNREAWRRQAKRFGLVVKEVKFPIPPTEEQVLKAFDAAFTPRTRVVHFNNPLGTYGIFLPVKKLAALAHSRNALCFIDGAHTMGMIQFSVSEWGVDGFACNAHKWLCGPAGSGLLYVKQDVQDRIWPNISIVPWDDPPKGARKYSLSVGRRPWPCVAALENAMDFQLAIGRARIEQRTRELGSYLRRRAAEIPKARVLTPTEAAMSCGSTNLGIDGVPAARLQELLRQKYDAYIPEGDDTVRISTHFFNTFEQVDRILAAMRELASGAA